jgi:hypothetical protein
LIDWLIDWLISWLIGWLIDWFIAHMYPFCRTLMALDRCSGLFSEMTTSR